MLSQECQTLICKTNFISIVCFAIENQEQHQKVWTLTLFLHDLSVIGISLFFSSFLFSKYSSYFFVVIETVKPSFASDKQSFEVQSCSGGKSRCLFSLKLIKLKTNTAKLSFQGKLAHVLAFKQLMHFG